MRKLTVTRLREIIVARDEARAAGYAMLERAERFFDGLHPEIFEAQMVSALRKTLASLDEMRELLYPLASGQGVCDEPPTQGPPAPEC